MPVISTFGYGSLVNAATRDDRSHAVPARLHGWRRAWRIASETPAGRSCSMTLEPEAGASVTGVVVTEPDIVLEALDKREWRYRRIPAEREAFDLLDEGVLPDVVHVYVARPEHYRWGDAGTPILQSYLDCVMKGFLDVFGREGVANFIAETHGWHVPVCRDRASPVYARAVELGPKDMALFDAFLAAAGVRYL